MFGRDNINSYTSDAALTPEDAWNLDKKSDDGKPGTGKLIIFRYAGCTDAANSTDFDADYDLTKSTIECALIFKQQF